MKPGFKTSEFWLALAAMIVGTLLASGAIGEMTTVGKALAFLGSALSSLGYSYSRGSAKGALPPAP